MTAAIEIAVEKRSGDRKSDWMAVGFVVALVIIAVIAFRVMRKRNR